MNHIKLNQVNAKIERGEMDNGHWFCACCQHITELNLDGPNAGVCVLCGSPRVRYHEDTPASESERKHVHVERRPVNRGGTVRPEERITREAAHKWFEAARRVAEQAAA